MTIDQLYKQEAATHDRETVYRIGRLDALKALIDAGLGETDVPEPDADPPPQDNQATLEQTSVPTHYPWPPQPD